MLFGFEDQADDGRAPRLDEAAEPPMPPTSTGQPWLFAVAGLLAGLLIALAAWTLGPDDQDGLTQADVDATVASALDAQAYEPDRAVAAFDQIAPSVVVVRALAADEDVATNIGAGVVINGQGQILTSHHVINSADSIELIFPNGSVSGASIVTTDPSIDMAVLSATARTGVLVPATLGNPRTLEVGDRIFAVGNPLGLTGSITEGVISGLNRNIPFPTADDGSGTEEPAALENLIQFDAAVNQGSSGGPLLNADGHVVGIVTALADPAGQGFFIGIGFAVPIDIAASAGTDGPSQ